MASTGLGALETPDVFDKGYGFFGFDFDRDVPTGLPSISTRDLLAAALGCIPHKLSTSERKFVPL